MSINHVVGLVWSFWYGDESSVLPTLPKFDVDAVGSDALEPLSDAFGSNIALAAPLNEMGYRLYVAYLDAEPVAYGWSASGQTFFGEPPVNFYLPAANHYLRDFVMLPAFRGLGIYP